DSRTSGSRQANTWAAAPRGSYLCSVACSGGAVVIHLTDRIVEHLHDGFVEPLLRCPVPGAEPDLEAAQVDDLDGDVLTEAVVAARRWGGHPILVKTYQVSHAGC